MENSESGDDGGPLGPTAFLSGSGVSTSYIGVQSDDMEGRLGASLQRTRIIKSILLL